MNKMNCNVIRDLLPLYADDICSEESKTMIEEHLKQCVECRKALEQMKGTLELSADHEEGYSTLKKIKKILCKKYVILALSAAVITGALVGASVLMQIVETPMDYESLKVSVVQNKKEPHQYDLTFNGQPYAGLVSERIKIKEDDKCIYEAAIIHCVSNLWTRTFEKKQWENEVTWSFSSDPKYTNGYERGDNGKQKYTKIVEAYYQATPGSERHLLWRADYFKN